VGGGEKGHSVFHSVERCKIEGNLKGGKKLEINWEGLKGKGKQKKEIFDSSDKKS